MRKREMVNGRFPPIQTGISPHVTYCTNIWGSLSLGKINVSGRHKQLLCPQNHLVETRLKNGLKEPGILVMET